MFLPFSICFILTIIVLPNLSPLVQATLIDTKPLIILGIAFGSLTAFLLKDLWLLILESDYQGIRANDRKKEQKIKRNLITCLVVSGVLGFGLINYIFLSSNLLLADKNIKENIQTKVLEIKIINRSFSCSKKEVTFQIPNYYIKDLMVPCQAEIKEGQLLNFSIRKGFWGFDIIELKV